jgi:hypothetical protein
MNELLKEDESSAKALLIVASPSVPLRVCLFFRGEQSCDFPLDQVDKGTLT